MAKPLYVPRVNNNDDFVQVSALRVAPGQRVAKGDIVADIETDKAVVEAEAEEGGFVLGIRYAQGDQAAVGSVLLWLGDSPDEAVPEDASPPQGTAGQAPTQRPTARALALLRRHGLTAEQVPARGERLSAGDIESFVANRSRSGAPARNQSTPSVAEAAPSVQGELVRLSPEELGMLQTVQWHQQHAAAGYLEIEYDPAPWEQAAKAYAERHRLLMSPVLPLMAWRLVRLAAERPRLNSTVVGTQRFAYGQVNLGFTVQVGDTLYLTVTRDAAGQGLSGFLRSLGEVQRKAMAHKLGADETQGATISFSSMARWNITRHMPILPPHTAVIVAHAATNAAGRAVLGATYDHRVLSGFDIARLLKDLAKPPALDEEPAAEAAALRTTP